MRASSWAERTAKWSFPLLDFPPQVSPRSAGPTLPLGDPHSLSSGPAPSFSTALTCFSTVFPAQRSAFAISFAHPSINDCEHLYLPSSVLSEPRRCSPYLVLRREAATSCRILGQKPKGRMSAVPSTRPSLPCQPSQDGRARRGC